MVSNIKHQTNSLVRSNILTWHRDYWTIFSSIAVAIAQEKSRRPYSLNKKDPPPKALNEIYGDVEREEWQDLATGANSQLKPGDFLKLLINDINQHPYISRCDKQTSWKETTRRFITKAVELPNGILRIYFDPQFFSEITTKSNYVMHTKTQREQFKDPKVLKLYELILGYYKYKKNKKISIQDLIYILGFKETKSNGAINDWVIRACDFITEKTQMKLTVEIEKQGDYGTTTGYNFSSEANKASEKDEKSGLSIREKLLEFKVPRETIDILTLYKQVALLQRLKDPNQPKIVSVPNYAAHYAKNSYEKNPSDFDIFIALGLSQDEAKKEENLYSHHPFKGNLSYIFNLVITPPITLLDSMNRRGKGYYFHTRNAFFRRKLEILQKIKEPSFIEKGEIVPFQELLKKQDHIEKQLAIVPSQQELTQTPKEFLAKQPKPTEPQSISNSLNFQPKTELPPNRTNRLTRIGLFQSDIKGIFAQVSELDQEKTLEKTLKHFEDQKKKTNIKSWVVKFKEFLKEEE